MTDEPQPSVGISKPRSLVESIVDGAIAVLDPSGQIVSWDPIAEELTGYGPGELVGRHFSVLHTPEDRDAGLPVSELALARAGKYAGEGWRVRKDGSRFPAGVALTPLCDRAGSIVGFAQVMVDLTQKKAEDEQLRKRRKTEEAGRLRDEFLFEARRELHLAVRTIQTHVKAAEGIGSAFHPDSTGVIKAKAAMLAWGLDQATKAMGHILELANQVAAELSSLPDRDPRPARRPVPETD